MPVCLTWLFKHVPLSVKTPIAMNIAPIRPRILIVEDDRCIQVLYRYLLKARFDVKLVDNVDDAIRVANREHFDLFLLDINLGEERTGADLLSLLRQMPAYGTTPAVACTAYAGHHYRQHFLSNGFAEHVDKPFSRPLLLGVIEQVLRTCRVHGQA